MPLAAPVPFVFGFWEVGISRKLLILFLDNKGE
jgi:hypothetical protein